MVRTPQYPARWKSHEVHGVSEVIMDQPVLHCRHIQRFPIFRCRPKAQAASPTTVNRVSDPSTVASFLSTLYINKVSAIYVVIRELLLQSIDKAPNLGPWSNCALGSNFHSTERESFIIHQYNHVSKMCSPLIPISIAAF